MVYDNRNLAYDLRLFEEEEMYSASKIVQKRQAKTEPKPKKLNKAVNQNVEAKTPKPKRKKKNGGVFTLASALALAAMIVVVVIMIIHGQVRLTELNQQINAAQKQLEEQQSLYTQLEMKVDASISTAVVEKYAQENLGMTKASNSQKEFVSLSKGDKVELTLEKNDTVFDTIADAFASLWA